MQHGRNRNSESDLMTNFAPGQTQVNFSGGSMESATPDIAQSIFQKPSIEEIKEEISDNYKSKSKSPLPEQIEELVPKKLKIKKRKQQKPKEEAKLNAPRVEKVRHQNDFKKALYSNPR